MGELIKNRTNCRAVVCEVYKDVQAHGVAMEIPNEELAHFRWIKFLDRCPS